MRSSYLSFFPREIIRRRRRRLHASDEFDFSHKEDRNERRRRKENGFLLFYKNGIYQSIYLRIRL
ncbi:hypothetical protein CSUI_007086 [Cystoisospora suis]|uniref:Uncharacterized protein n=1 Tax=Cystoisospora suis TaxID=483139 RepID=A0A2C6JWY2_9APIC|nr:hypothetical protein CSUI_007086 [Cystoisospora suis]